LDESDAAFDRSSWRHDWLNNAEGFHPRCLLQAQGWKTRQARRGRAGNQLAIQQTTLAGLQSGIAQAETHMTAAEAFAAFDGELSNKQHRRQTIKQSFESLLTFLRTTKSTKDTKLAVFLRVLRGKDGEKWFFILVSYLFGPRGNRRRS